ncbi:MAG: F0F1 ATP synthase subunit B [Patescibacteria group bacterium]
MQIFKDFGVNPVLLAAQIVNFLIILFVLKRFMYKPVIAMLKKREDEIKKGLSDSEKNQKQLIETVEKEKAILQAARENADKMIAAAKLEATESKNQIEAATKKEIEKMREQARETIEQETKAAEERLTRHIGEIAISLLEKSLTGIFGEKEQKSILKKAEAELRK